MLVFTKNTALEIFGELWLRMIKETKFGPNFKKLDMSVLFVIVDPDFTMFVAKDEPQFDEAAKVETPDVTIAMNGNTAHKFWLKQILFPKALATNQIKAKGSVEKLLQILPLLEPGYELYPEYCKKFNLPTLINTGDTSEIL